MDHLQSLKTAAAKHKYSTLIIGASLIAMAMSAIPISVSKVASSSSLLLITLAAILNLVIIIFPVALFLRFGRITGALWVATAASIIANALRLMAWYVPLAFLQSTTLMTVKESPVRPVVWWLLSSLIFVATFWGSERYFNSWNNRWRYLMATIFIPLIWIGGNMIALVTERIIFSKTTF